MPTPQASHLSNSSFDRVDCGGFTVSVMERTTRIDGTEGRLFARDYVLALPQKRRQDNVVYLHVHRKSNGIRQSYISMIC